jgi:hypothetical protein
MILFKFPKKKITLDCFTSEAHILRTAPIVPAIKLIPEWWKKLPNSYYKNNEFSPSSTMKHCIGMVDYYKKSIVLPLWSDLAINIKSSREYYWQFSDRYSTAVQHNMEKQATGFLNGYSHIKLITPWAFKTKENISWVWSHPTYSYPNSHEVVSLPAVVNHLYMHGTNINLLFSANTPKTIIIPQGQPLVHIIPMSDRKVEIVRHLVSEAEYKKIKSVSTHITFLDKYIKTLDRIKQFKNCPFHNHIEGK